MEMIIYKITNLIDGKCYIGQSIHDFNTRYSGGKWWSLTSSSYLQNAVQKHGLINFKVEFLEEKVESIEKLNELEIYYAELYNAYTPNGYNLVGCGGNSFMLQWQKDFLSEHHPLKKKITLRNIDTWELIEFNGLRKFARENNLNCSALRNMINKLNGTVVSQGFCLPERTREEIEFLKKKSWKNESIELIRPNGSIVFYDTVKLAAISENLNERPLRSLLKGSLMSCYGYRLKNPPRERRKFIYNHTLISPDGDEFLVNKLTLFCKENKTCSKGIKELILGVRSIYAGWTLKKYQNTEDSTIIVEAQ